MSQQGLLTAGTSGSPNVETLTGNTGGPVAPDGAFNINIVGSSPIEVTGNPGTNTLTIDTNGSVAITYTEDSGTATPSADNINVFGDISQGSVTNGAGDTITITNSDASEIQKGVIETSTDAESIAGSVNNVSVVPTSLKAKLGAQTQYGITYGDTDTNPLQWTSSGTDGQLIIAATGAAPAFSSLTSTGGTITYTPGANSLNLEASSSVAIDFDTDAGTATPIANTLDILGTPVQGISTSGATNVVTITAADATTTQKGVIETSTNAESIAGSATDVAITPASLSAKLGVQTSEGIPYGTGTSLALGWTSALTDGQLVIGSTAGIPAAANLTSSDSTISISNGSNTIDLVTGSTVVVSFDTDSGTAVPSSGTIDISGGTLINTSGATNVVTINADDNVVGSVVSDSGTVTPSTNSFTVSGGNGISTSGSGSTLTIDSTGGGLDWFVEIGTTANLANNSGNIGNNAVGVTFTLPASSSVGDIIRVTGLQSSWTIAQNAGQTIYFGNDSTTTGAGGSLSSTNARDVVELVCVVANTDYQVLSSIGSITVT